LCVAVAAGGLFIIDPEYTVLITLKGLRFAILLNISARGIVISESRFRIREMQVHDAAGSIVNEYEERASRAAVFKPTVIAAVDLD
jgi:hypothetical protein